MGAGLVSRLAFESRLVLPFLAVQGFVQGGPHGIPAIQVSKVSAQTQGLSSHLQSGRLALMASQARAKART